MLVNQAYKENLKLTLDIRAKGGRYPTAIGVVLGGLDKKYINEATIVTRIVFDDAYPKFRGWVTSNGADNKDWYLHPVGGKMVEAW